MFFKTQKVRTELKKLFKSQKPLISHEVTTLLSPVKLPHFEPESQRKAAAKFWRPSPHTTMRFYLGVFFSKVLR